MLPCCPAFAILTAKMFADQEKNSLKSKVFGFNFSVFMTAFLFLCFAILSGIGILIFDWNQPEIIMLPAFLLIGVFFLIRFHRIKSFCKMVFSIAMTVSLSFAILSGDILPLINRYPMKKFADHINQENIKGPIAIYKLGSHRARLGVLTGRTVITLRSNLEVDKFLSANQKAYMVIKKKDWDENFLSLKMKIIMMDDIQVKTQIQKKEIYKVFN